MSIQTTARTYRSETAYKNAEFRKSFYNCERFNNMQHYTIKDAEGKIARNSNVSIVALKNGDYPDGYALKSITETLALSFALRGDGDHLVDCFRRCDIDPHDIVSYR